MSSSGKSEFDSPMTPETSQGSESSKQSPRTRRIRDQPRFDVLEHVTPEFATSPEMDELLSREERRIRDLLMSLREMNPNNVVYEVQPDNASSTAAQSSSTGAIINFSKLKRKLEDCTKVVATMEDEDDKDSVYIVYKKKQKPEDSQSDSQSSSSSDDNNNLISETDDYKNE